MARRSHGTGSLYLRVDSAGRETWYGHWRSNGRQIKRRVGPRRLEGTREGFTRPQAERELRRLMQDTRIAAPASEALTFAQAGERYRADLKRRGRKKATLVAVESALRVRLTPTLGDKPLSGITERDVADLMTIMEADELSDKTIRNYLGTLSAIFNWAQRKRLCGDNPVRYVELPERTGYAAEVRFLEPVEVTALVAATPAGAYHDVDRALYLTAALTGLRQGELIALRWCDVDWPAGRIRVRRNYVLGEFGTPKSRRSERSIPMADAVAGELDRLHQAHGNPADDALVFPDPETAGPLRNAAVLRRFRRALEAAHLDTSHRFHDLRHTFGTRMAGAGVAMRTLQEWMGHRDIQTTQRYADYAPAHDEAALIAEAFAPSSAMPSGPKSPRGSTGGSNLSESDVI